MTDSTKVTESTRARETTQSTADGPGPVRRRPSSRVARPAAVSLLIIVVCAGVGLGTALAFPTQYAARAQLVYLIGAEQPTGFLREDRNLSTQVQILQSRAVLAPVAATFGLSEPDLAQKLEVELVSGTEVLNLRLIDPSREAGQAMLQQVIERYVTVSGDVAPQNLRSYLEGQLADTRSRMAEAGSATQRDALVEREMALLDRLDSVNLAGAQVNVVVPPYSDPGAVSPRPLLGAAAGALAGVVLAGCLVLWQARRWTRE